MKKTDLKQLPALFLDRDGVINVRKPGDYVRTWDQFVFLPGVLNLLKRFRIFFHPIIIVTNQQGVGKGLMTISQVETIHHQMKRVIRKSGGKIDAVYFCPDLALPPSPCRKPNSGMGLGAKLDFPEINFNHSWMVGDSESDVLFGKKLGMKSVFLNPEKTDASGQADYVFKDLQDFYSNFVKKMNRIR